MRFETFTLTSTSPNTLLLEPHFPGTVVSRVFYEGGLGVPVQINYFSTRSKVWAYAL